jgi:hypothetical protein
MLDYLYAALLRWVASLPGVDTAATIVYGVVAAAFVAGGYAWLVSRREHERAYQMKVAAFRYFRLRNRGERIR